MNEVVNFSALLKDKDKLNEIGSEITKRAIIAALEQKMGLQASYTPGQRIVRKGELVPADLIGKVKLGPGGVAADGWSDSGWTDLGIWERSTWDKTGDPSERVTIGDIRTLPPLERMKALSKLNQEELGILKSLKYID